MFSQGQNVVSSRELFTSNPCRDLWDSQMFSQAWSGSQGSLQSSSELFSQPKSGSQQPRSSSFNSHGDNWPLAAPQHADRTEDPPTKYYMKYLTKPPLFPEPKTNIQEKSQAEEFKEFIEAQKKKAVESDQRDLMESFIGLLKEYTKEVQQAMSSLKDSITTNMTTHVEEIASAADKSVNIVNKLKEDFTESFLELRKDIMESEDLRSTLSKYEKELAKKEEEAKLLAIHFEGCKERERKALEREETYLKRESDLLEKLKEIEAERTTAETCRASKDQKEIQHLCEQLSEFRKRESKALEREEKYLEREQQLLEKLKEQQTPREVVAPVRQIPAPTHQPQLVPEQFPDTLNNKGCRETESIPQRFYTSQHKEGYSLPFVNHAPGRFVLRENAVQSEGVAMVEHQSTLRRPLRDAYTDALACSAYGNDDAFKLPSARSSLLGIVPGQPPSSHPTAAILPIQTATALTHIIKPTQEGQLGSRTQRKEQVISGPKDLKFPDERMEDTIPAIQEETGNANSPGNWVSTLHFSEKVPKRSPIATVRPQVQIKKEVTVKECNSYEKNDDPLKMFFIDLTTTPSSKDQDASEKATEQMHAKDPTTSFSESLNFSQPNSKRKTKSAATSDVAGKRYDTRSQSRTVGQVERKGTNSPSILSKEPPTMSIKRKVKETQRQGGYGSAKRLCIDTTEEVPKESTVVRKKDLNCAKMAPFRCNEAKRTLHLGSSSLFEVSDEEISIQQITESIRKHALKRKLRVENLQTFQ